MLGFLGCFACLLVASVADADGRVFAVEVGNSSSSSGFRDAEWACASRRARLASASELRHAVMECFFSACTRGWLHGGSVGTTVCNYVGGSLKAVEVRTENATGDAASVNGFCIKDKGVPCGDPPSFPNARLQGHGGVELGDELLYTCVPGYVMPNGHSAFSLLCDSCGEWYGLVQICVKDSTEAHVDYEDQFTYGEADHQSEDDRPAEDLHGTEPDPEEPMDRALQEISFEREKEESDPDGRQEVEVDGEEAKERRSDEKRSAEDSAAHPSWKQEVTTASTDPPVSLLSQKHLFWFPSEAFQQQRPVSVDPVTQTTTQRSSGSRSEESLNDHNRESLDHRDDGPAEQQIPVRHDGLDEQDRYEDRRDDHYDMGEHEEVRYGGRNDSAEERAVHEDGSDLQEHPGGSEEHPDQNDHDDDVHQEHNDRDDKDRHDDHDEHRDRDDHDRGERDRDDQYDLVDQDNHEDHGGEDHNHETDDGRQDGDNGHAEHDSHEDDNHQRVLFSEKSQNATRHDAGVATATDETWLDGHPVAAHPNEVEEPVPDSSVPAAPETGAPDNPASSSSSDAVEYDTQQVVPTHSWLLDLTRHPFLDPAQDSDDLDGVTGERALHNLPGETGERGEVEGETGGAVCVGENCPPPGPSRRGPTVAAIIAAVCVVAAAVTATVWCYRRRQQKSSVYDINGKGQSNQHMEMQQKV
ncbi:sarcoplasmic reticulum histidine-rich calcium-binding protein [Phycodurus eques]|uniref:sarcoplasmic reticulum histidine-rich calcium-binding protein n=1 Tax=Phycodurus eques TaxID=693459 RepID=UPI002ACDEABC|nr:sarcoplasmic reticulum histidine-rich calcium-binding protein [Phycodurus eques]